VMERRIVGVVEKGLVKQELARVVSVLC
jgi:hypothetical protein